MNKIIFVVVCFMFTVSINADVKSRAVEDFFKAAKMKERHELSIKVGYNSTMAKFVNNPNVSVKEKKKFEIMKKFVFKKMVWETVKEDFKKLYMKTYTVGELRKLTRFFKSPIGQTFIEKERMLIPETAKIGEERIKKIMPQLREHLK